ncbi:hypothetical protein FOZ63_015367 [Perkinsus olseni]|uniref:Serine aminopeptidase S33 domain-containing protein n=1 Tax=Perkinsus olseni TaxID=32597 RepID=A0A7J6PUL1_PEROL|nr:hypothetical protein FOZ63_015367 [Perkinsus olseni]
MGSGLSHIIFQAPKDPTYTNDGSLIWLQTRLGSIIPACYLDRGATLTVLFSHGNAEDLGMVMRYWREMAPTINVNVFAYEYTGYGLSRGPPTPSEDHLYSDVEAAFKYIRDVIGVPWERTVVFGRSLGSGPSVHLASITAVRGLILQSPVLSIFRVGLRFRYTLPGDSFLNIDKMEYVRCPVYVIHGTDDEIVPLWHGKALYELAKHSVTPFWVEGGGHNNLEILAYDQFLFRLKNFLHQLETLPLDEQLRDQAVTCPL